MANEAHLARLKQGVRAWNQWRDANPTIGLDLAGADLRGADLTRRNLAGVNLRTANLTGADLCEAFCVMTDFREADLMGANLTRVNLRLAMLCRANLERANLQDAELDDVDLQMANLSGAELAGAIFYGVKMGGTILANVDLSTARELTTVGHQGPSTISIDTLYRSRGQIPEGFLRRAGVPKEILTHMRGLVGRVFEFYSCFISYARKDEEFARRLYADLDWRGISCWFSPEDVQGGRKLEEQIDQAIRLYDRLLLILSPHSMQSEWVKTEIAKARLREVQEQRQVLFPIRLVSYQAIREWKCFDADTGKDSAQEIRAYFIPDFSNWQNHDAYQAAFRRLLRDLKPDTILL